MVGGDLINTVPFILIAELYSISQHISNVCAHFEFCNKNSSELNPLTESSLDSFSWKANNYHGFKISDRKLYQRTCSKHIGSLTLVELKMNETFMIAPIDNVATF